MEKRRAIDHYPVDDWLDDLMNDRRTLQEIGHEHDISRQRVSQLVSEIHPGWWSEKMEKKKQLKRLDELSKIIESVTDCRTCGKSFPGHSNRKVYCSDECREIRGEFRTILDEEEWVKHQKAVARWSLENLDNETIQKKIEENPGCVNYWENILNDRWDQIDNHGRWLIEGSKKFDNAVRAVEEGWPIADEFHPDILKQVNQYIVSKRSTRGEEDGTA